MAVRAVLGAAIARPTSRRLDADLENAGANRRGSWAAGERRARVQTRALARIGQTVASCRYTLERRSLGDELAVLHRRGARRPEVPGAAALVGHRLGTCRSERGHFFAAARAAVRSACTSAHVRDDASASPLLVPLAPLLLEPPLLALPLLELLLEELASASGATVKS